MLSLYIFFDFRLKQFQLQAFTYQNKKHNPLFFFFKQVQLNQNLIGFLTIRITFIFL